MNIGKRIRVSTNRFVQQNEPFISFLYYIKRRLPSGLEFQAKYSDAGYMVKLKLEPTIDSAVLASIIHQSTNYKIVRWTKDKPVVLQLNFKSVSHVRKTTNSIKLKELKSKKNRTRKTKNRKIN